MKLMTLLSSVWLTGCSVFGVRTVEEPPYHVVERIGTVEIRHYEPRIAADTVVRGSEMQTRNLGFRRIAGYIFGANHTRAAIPMTAPVAQARGATQGSSATIPMTAPVAQARDENGQFHIQFFMPAGSTLATLPLPNDPAVRLLEVPAATMAVLRFSGTPSTGAVSRQSAALLRDLAPTTWAPTATPVAWFYDPPWTIPPLRRNEVAVSVQRKSG